MIKCGYCGYEIKNTGTLSRNTKHKGKHYHTACLEQKLKLRNETLKKLGEMHYDI